MEVAYGFVLNGWNVEDLAGHYPGDQSDRVTLSHEELSLLLGGIDLTRTRRKDWYRKTVPESGKV